MLTNPPVVAIDQSLEGRQTRKAVVFYDGACPMCRREIGHYRKRRGSAELNWIDVSRPSPELDAYGLGQASAMARFHVLDENGRWQTGAWGFAELWSHLPAYRWAATLVRRLRLLPLLDAAYTRFARWRLRGRCLQASCGSGDR